MSIYTDLARLVYNELFFPNQGEPERITHILQRSLEGTQKFIESQMDGYCSDKAQRALFRMELRRQIQTQYLIPSSQQVLKRMNWKELTEIYKWLEKDQTMDSIDVENQVNQLQLDDPMKKWLDSKQTLQKLANNLAEIGFLERTLIADFKNVMTGKGKGGRMKWTANTTLLIYLLTELQQIKAVSRLMHIPDFVELNFLDKRGKDITGVKQMVNNITLTKSEKPRDHSVIDDIIKKSFTESKVK